ncbi:MAG TPA: extracellular solute-binding protein, partial [Thermomicrobiales bacterium]|nr:extracellular solute-binding protein [Thermomicrobiales bacterium]
MTGRISRRTVLGNAAKIGAAAGAGAFAGAGKRNATSAAPAAVPAAAPAFIQSTGSKVQVRYWTSFATGVNGDAQNKLIADFNAANPDIEVVAVPQESYEAIAQALIAGLQTGDVPDLVLFSEAWWFRFYLAQVVVDLNTLITPETRAEDYHPTLFKEYQRNGGQYAIPFARSTPLLYYNAEM